MVQWRNKKKYQFLSVGKKKKKNWERENVSSGICRQQRPRSACAFARSSEPLLSSNRIWKYRFDIQADLSFHWVLIEAQFLYFCTSRPRWFIWMRRPTGDQEVAGSTLTEVGNIDHEIFSTVILSLLLIQEGQLSVSGDRMCTILVNRLKD